MRREHRFDFLVRGEAFLACCFEPVVNAFKFFECGAIGTALESGVDFHCDLDKPLLGLVGPSLYSLQLRTPHNAMMILDFLAAAVTVLVFGWNENREREISTDEIAQMERDRLGAGETV